MRNNRLIIVFILAIIVATAPLAALAADFSADRAIVQPTKADEETLFIVSDGGDGVITAGHVHGGQTAYTGIIRRYNNDGRQLWEYSTHAETDGTKMRISGLAPYGDGFLVAYKVMNSFVLTDDNPLGFFVLDRNGAVVKRSAMASSRELIAAIAVRNNDVFTINENDELECFDGNSQFNKRWGVKLGKFRMSCNNIAVAQDGLIISYDNISTLGLYKYDFNGNELWYKEYLKGHQPYAMAQVGDNLVIATAARQMLCVNAAGSTLWTTSTQLGTGSEIASLASDGHGGIVAAVNTKVYGSQATWLTDVNGQRYYDYPYLGQKAEIALYDSSGRLKSTLSFNGNELGTFSKACSSGGKLFALGTTASNAGKMAGLNPGSNQVRIIAAFSAIEQGWAKENNVWHYYKNKVLQKGWLLDGSHWYYLHAQTGDMLTGWQKVNYRWYFLNPNGDMKTGWLKNGGMWYLLAPSGEMLTGWQKDGSGVWYFLKSSGAMAANEWVKTGGKWYWLGADGSMATGSRTINGVRYRFNSSGAWLP